MKKGTSKPNGKHLYLKIADLIELQIQNGVLSSGDKLPSIRTICKDNNISMSTAQLAYSTLVDKSLIEARSKSGYYVSNWLNKNLDLPQTSNPSLDYNGKTDDELVARVFDSQREIKTTRLSYGAPANEFLPISQRRGHSKPLNRLTMISYFSSITATASRWSMTASP